jgi:hypothetical protein
MLHDVLERIVATAPKDMLTSHFYLRDQVGDGGLELNSSDFDGDGPVLAGDEANLDRLAGGEGVLGAFYGELIEITVNCIEFVAGQGAELCGNDLQQCVIYVLAS